MFDTQEYQPTISSEDVKEYLTAWSKRGFVLQRGRPNVTNGWSIDFGSGKWIGVLPYPHARGYWCITNSLSTGRITGPKGSIGELKNAFENSCHELEIGVDATASQYPTFSKKPLSVWLSLNSIIGTSKVTAVYDPYLQVKSLAKFILLAHLGTEFTSELKLLATRTDITAHGLALFNSELGLNSVLKITPKNHPRFLLLDDGRCISIDFSICDEQDGTIFEVDHPSTKFQIFNSEWSAAERLS